MLVVLFISQWGVVIFLAILSALCRGRLVSLADQTITITITLAIPSAQCMGRLGGLVILGRLGVLGSQWGVVIILAIFSAQCRGRLVAGYAILVQGYWVGGFFSWGGHGAELACVQFWFYALMVSVFQNLSL